MTTIAKVAENLREIAALAGQLEARAIDRGGDADVPGGEATLAQATVASLAMWQELLDQAEAFGPVDLQDELDDDQWPPLQVLWYWSEVWRAERDMYVPKRPSIATEAAFLALPEVLEHAWNHEPHWDDFAADVRRARTTLENIIRAGRRADRSRVVCDRCEGGRRLIKVWAKPFVAAWECQACGDRVAQTRECTTCHHRHQPGPSGRCGHQADRRKEPCVGTIKGTAPTECECGGLLTPVVTSNPADDRWKCPSCKRLFDDREHHEAHSRQLRTSEADRWVSVADAVDLLRRLGWQERTVRRWIDPTRDKCAECAEEWSPGEHVACPARAWSEGEWAECGGELVPVLRGEVLEAWCDLKTRQRWVWWPSLWARHQREKATRAARRAGLSARRVV